MNLTFKNIAIYGRCIIVSLSIILMVQSSCKKGVDVPSPSNGLSSESIFNSDATAAAVLTNIYAKMSDFGSFTTHNSGLSFLCGLSADEFTLSNSSTDLNINSYYKNSLSVNAGGGEFWNSIYQYIFISNSAIEGITKSQKLTPAVKSQLLGEAKFVRAFCYFYLVNLYGDVPVVTGIDYKTNALLPKSPKSEVYALIISDLKDANNLLNDKYTKSDGLTSYSTEPEERVRPNKWVATALLARVYLYTKDYANAKLQATAIINNSSEYGLTALNDVFLKNSKEAIWQLQPTNSAITNTLDAYLFIIPSYGPNGANPVYLSDYLMNSFETNDQRKTSWINSTSIGTATYNYAYKYKVADFFSPVVEYTMIFRLGEQYLIRAEAETELGNVSGAQNDLNAIRLRAGLGNTRANDKATLLKAIAHERQCELFTELGHRWLDIKRMNGFTNQSQALADEVMPAITTNKGGAWNTNWKLYPIPLGDLQKDHNLVQNPGYGN